jgi:hypothetical protein
VNTWLLLAVVVVAVSSAVEVVVLVVIALTLGLQGVVVARSLLFLLLVAFIP